MGAYRLFLAFCVLYSHVFGSIFGWNIGVVAVISFFVMSGYVMTFLVSRYYNEPRKIGGFYLDRAARLFPQYLFYLTLTLIFASLFNFTDPFLQSRGPLYITLNATILPIGYYMFGLENALYVPPAWSLGLELTFYLFFPLFWFATRRFKLASIAISVGFGVAALSGMLNTDWFGYRLLPGTFFIFAVGIAFARPQMIGRWYPVAAICLSAIGAVIVFATPSLYSAIYNKEVMTGIVVGVVMVGLLRQKPFGAVDELLGNLSYGVFLNHFLMMWLVDHFSLSRLFVPVAALIAAAISYKLIEAPALRWRRQLRAIEAQEKCASA